MKGKFKLNHLIVHLILLVGVIVVVFPFAWMILTSFKTSGEAMKIPPTIFPEKFVTTAYHTIVTSAIPFATVYMNTIITTVVTHWYRLYSAPWQVMRSDVSSSRSRMQSLFWCYLY